MTDNDDQRKAEVEAWVEENKEYLIKQAEMLQSVITRMANNSLEVKKFGIAIWAAIVGFGIDKTNRWLFILAFATFILFGVLDIYYLFLERVFRDNFNRLTRLLGEGYPSGNEANDKASDKYREWVEQKRKGGGNFLIPDWSSSFLKPPSFLTQLKGERSILKSWANLPYLITFLITILLWFVPLA